MDRSSQITLIKQTYSQNDIGEYVASETATTIFCSLKSVNQTEWFDGARKGMSPEYQVIINRNEYDGQTICSLNGIRYSIYRTYATKGENLELYLEKQVGTERIITSA